MNGEHKTGGGAATQDPGRLLRLPETLGRVGLGRTAWLDLVRDGRAPRPIHVGRAALWIEAEILAWIAERIRAHRTIR